MASIPSSPNPIATPQIPAGDLFTLTYSNGVNGWPSFYSYNPDYMVGMNNYFYTFSGGNLYRHNTNRLRNNFYGQQYNSSITTVINDSPLNNKLFKTIALESDSPWNISLNTDMNNQAFINNTWFELKEGAYYAAIKNTAQSPTTLADFDFRSVNGIGKTTGYTATNPRVFSFVVPIDSIISIGDYLYYLNEFTIATDSITVDSTIPGATDPTTGNPLMMALKNSIAESHGILGHYALISLENIGPNRAELFAVESQIMKSYP